MSSPTAALLRKDGPWLCAFLLLGTVLAGLVFGDNEVEGIFVVPEARFAEEFEFLLVPCAVLFALVASLGETLRSTRDLLRHRPVGPGRIFWVRHLAALAVIGAWTGFGMLAAWIQEFWSGANGACVDPSRFGALAAMSAGLALDYALVVLGLGLPMAWLARFAFAAAFLFLRYAAQSTLAFLDPSWGAYLLACALGTALALWVAARCEDVGHDPDRPTPGRALAGAGAACVAAAAFFGAIATSGWHKLALEGLAHSRPMMARLGENEVGLLGQPDSEHRWAVLDEHGEPTGRRVPLVATDHRAAPRPKEPDFNGMKVTVLHPPFAWYLSRAGEPVTRRAFPLEDVVRIVDFLEDGARRCWTLPLPAGTARSRGAGLVELSDGKEEPLFFYAPEHGELWLVDNDTPPKLVPQTLPGPERALRIEYARDEAGDTQRVVATATQRWRFQAGAWQPFGTLEVPRTTYTVLDDDSLRPEVEIRLASGAALRHRYGLASAREWLCAGFAVVATVVRPSSFALLGAALDYGEVSEAYPDEALLTLDPLLGGGHRWLLALNLAFTGLLTLLLTRELRRRGVAGARLVLWSLAVPIAGAFAGTVLVALEPRRAWRKPARTEPPPPLVVAA